MTTVSQTVEGRLGALQSALRRSGRSPATFLRTYARSFPAAISLGIITIIVLIAIAAPLIAPRDPLDQDLLGILRPLPWMEGGTWSHLLGTDNLGRDVLSRSMHGARISLGVAIPATLIGATIGTILGLYAGYKRGLLDALTMRLVDVQTAFPLLLVAIATVAFIGGGTWQLVTLLGVWGFALYARLVRGETLSAVSTEYVIAAQALGASPARIMFRHVLPNVLTPVIVVATVLLPQLIIVEASLSFLGLGIPKPTPSWGNMLADSRTQLQIASWLLIGPGTLMVLSVLSINLMGDRLREIWDPRLRGHVE